MCRGLVLSCIAFALAHWGYLSLESPAPLDWGQAAQTALEAFFPQVVLAMAHQGLERLRSLAQRLGFDFHLNWCKI